NKLNRAMGILLNTSEIEDDKVAEIIFDLSLNNDSEASKIAQAMEKYIQIIDEPIAIKEILNNNEMIALVQAEEIIKNRKVMTMIKSHLLHYNS
ncbi:25926_t:CDS:2, partial [Racocetra persica]